MQNLESQFTFKLKQKSSSFSAKKERNCNIQPNCFSFNKLSTSEFQQFLSLQYFVDTFYWSGRVEVCLGQRERFIAILISSPGTAFSTLYANIVYRHRQFSTMHHQAGMVQ